MLRRWLLRRRRKAPGSPRRAEPACYRRLRRHLRRCWRLLRECRERAVLRNISRHRIAERVVVHLLLVWLKLARVKAAKETAPRLTLREN